MVKSSREFFLDVDTCILYTGHILPCMRAFWLCIVFPGSGSISIHPHSCRCNLYAGGPRNLVDLGQSRKFSDVSYGGPQSRI